MQKKICLRYKEIIIVKTKNRFAFDKNLPTYID